MSANWLVDKKERRAGAAIRVICKVQSPIWDEAFVPLPGSGLASAEVTVSDLDVTDPSFTVEKL